MKKLICITFLLHQSLFCNKINSPFEVTINEEKIETIDKSEKKSLLQYILLQEAIENSSSHIPKKSLFEYIQNYYSSK
jgi:hypothetical protein